MPRGNKYLLTFIDHLTVCWGVSHSRSHGRNVRRCTLTKSSLVMVQVRPWSQTKAESLCHLSSKERAKY
jgi:hypothetical protein